MLDYLKDAGSVRLDIVRVSLYSCSQNIFVCFVFAEFDVF